MGLFEVQSPGDVLGFWLICSIVAQYLINICLIFAQYLLNCCSIVAQQQLNSCSEFAHNFLSNYSATIAQDSLHKTTQQLLSISHNSPIRLAEYHPHTLTSPLDQPSTKSFKASSPQHGDAKTAVNPESMTQHHQRNSTSQSAIP